jgi:hypothetical protein
VAAHGWSLAEHGWHQQQRRAQGDWAQLKLRGEPRAAAAAAVVISSGRFKRTHA